MATLVYNAEAELFLLSKPRSRERPVAYRRFARAADGDRFAIEELPPALLLGASLGVDEERFNRNAIRQLYQSSDYPLTRRAEARRSNAANA
jgi:hypothetical protein